MPTNLNIDDSLLDKAVILGKHKSKREAVNTALEEYVKLRKQMRIKEFFNQEVYNEIDFLRKVLDNYKYKKKGLIRIVEQIFRDKLIMLIEFIRNLIESHYFDQIKEEIFAQL